MVRSWLGVVVIAGVLGACAATPPPRWQEGGAPLVIAPARWERSGEDPIEILPNGQVVQDGDLLFAIDRAGRIFDGNNEPLGILLPDGFLAGTDNRLLGRIGVANAAPPGGAAAWLAILPDGRVVYFDDDGERTDGGVWRGCDGPQLRTCTLVTDWLRVQQALNRPRVTVGVGIGVGF
ncbi:MAG: hypothetical protein OZ928_10765 [Polyangiaceae bacterium]|nr:hypothetical protein [Polyangiaceae bacterium]